MSNQVIGKLGSWQKWSFRHQTSLWPYETKETSHRSRSPRYIPFKRIRRWFENRKMDVDPRCVLLRLADQIWHVASSFKLLMIPVALYWNHRALVNFGVLGKGTPNPFEPLLWPSYQLESGRYDKGLKDWLFVFNHVIFWSLWVSIFGVSGVERGDSWSQCSTVCHAQPIETVRCLARFEESKAIQVLGT